MSIRSAPVPRMRRMYWELSEATDRLEIATHALDDFTSRAVAAVLLEDLEQLQEECEELLVTPVSLDSIQVESIEARIRTVLDEVSSVLQYLTSPPLAGRFHARRLKVASHGHHATAR